MNRETASLRQLARLYRVQPSHYDGLGRRVVPPPETLLRVLKLLGAPVERVEDSAEAVRARRLARWSRPLEPVTVLWQDRPARCRMRVPVSRLGEAARWSIALEAGGALEGVCRLEAPGRRPREIDGTRYAAAALPLPRAIPIGYHRLSVETGGRRATAVLISAPATAFAPIRGKEKSWGIFAPLYALHSRTSWGAGDLSDLERVLDWAERLGADLFSTLPLLPLFLDGPIFDPSPYAPVSRLFWNEFYVDVSRAPELAAAPDAQALLGSSGFQAELAALRAAPLVEYRRVMGLKRSVLEKLAAALFASDSPRRRELEHFARLRPEVADFADFRARLESEGKSWSDWPEPDRSGKIAPDPRREPAKRYHLYAQWLAHEQLAAASGKAARGGPSLYLDFPLGVHAAGYDVWRYRRAFALGANGGAPPDLFFTKGQDWGFPPLHPEGLREEAYAYYVAAVRHQLSRAGVLRIDHVMGFHRLYWVPHGARPQDGVYVRYPAEEFYAILCLESQRHRAAIVGENLGTVPPYVNEALARRRIRGMDVGQFAVREDPARAIVSPPPPTVACLTTHDTPTFAAFWQGLEIDDRVDLGILDAARAGEERERRRRVNAAVVEFLRREGRIAAADPEPSEVLAGWLAHLAAGPVEHVLVSLEDLWLENEPQNTPGTWQERVNWRRKTRRPFEEYCNDPNVLYTLSVVRDLRGR